MTKKTNFKKHLLASASVLAIGAFAAQGAFAAAVTRGDAGTTALSSGDTLDFSGTHGVTTGIATVADGVNIGVVTANNGLGAGNGGSAGDGTGTLTFSGSSTDAALIGTTTNRVGILNAGATGATVNLNGAAFVDATHVTGTGTLSLGALLTGSTLNFDADGTVSLASGVGLTDVTTTTTTGTGTLTLVGGSQTVTGAVGLTGTRLKVINAAATGATSTFANDVFAVTTNVTGTGTLALSGNLTGTTLAFGADGVVTIANGKTLTAAVTTATTGTGTLTFTQGATMTGDIGASGLSLLKVGVGTGTAGTVTASGNIFATTVDFGNKASTLSMTNGKNITGSVLSTGGVHGTLTFTGATTADSTISGSVGVASGTGLTALNHTAGLDGSVLTLNGSDNFIGTTSIGAGQLALNGNLTGAVGFVSAGSTGNITVATGKNVTGAITTDTTDNGTVVYSGTSTQTGALGATGGNLLHLITINAGTVTTTAGVAATTVNFAADGALSVAGGQILKAAVTNTTSGQGTVTFAGAGTMTGALGASGHLLKLVTVGNGAVTASSNIYATTVNFAGDNALTVATGATVASAITTSTTNTGTLTLAGTTTLTGNVGTSSKLLKQVNIGSGGATTTTLTGNVYATGLDFNTDSTLSVAAGNSFTSSNTATAAITTTSDNTGTLTFLGGTTVANIIGASATELKAINFNGGTATVSKSINAATTTVAAGATVNFTAASSNATDLVTAGTGKVNVGTTTTTLTAGTTAAGNLTIGSATSTLATTINSATNNDSGKLVVAGTADLGNANVSVHVASTNYSAAGSTYNIVTSTGAMSNTGVTVTDDSYALNYTSSVTGGGKTLTLTSVRANTYQSSSTLVNEQAVGSALETIGNSGDTALDTVHGGLDALTSSSSVESALKTLTPNNVASGSTSAAVFQTSGAAIGTVEHHMETARNEMSGTGIATGGHMNRNGIWGEVFGSNVDQTQRRGVDGYQANVGGASIGADTLVNNQTRVGAAFAYGRTDARGTGNKTNVDTYQGSVYGTYDMGKVYYEGVGTFAYNDYKTTRNLFDGSVADGSFQGQQYDAKATAGYKLDIQGGLKVTPFVSAEYAFVTQDSYTETGSNANLAVSPDDINIFKTGLGAKLAYPIMEGGVTYNPRMSAAYYYDFIGDEASSTANFTSATTTFVTKGASVARNSFRLGAGLDVMSQDNVTVSLDYNWDTKQDFNAHTGELKARFEF